MTLDFFETRQLIGKNIDKPNEGRRDYRGTRSGGRDHFLLSAFSVADQRFIRLRKYYDNNFESL